MNTAIFKDYLELSKPRIMLMVLVTTFIGYWFGAQNIPAPWLLGWTLLGTALAVSGSGVLNNYLERDSDARMERTRNRSIPAGRVHPLNALIFGTSMVLIGVFLLAWKVNLLTAFLVLLAAFLYVLVYTPMKKLTWLNTSVGAIPGAIPPMAGWAASTGNLEVGAWILFAVLFTWQHPHFYAISWIYREDYRRGGFKMISEADPTGKLAFRHSIFFSALLIVSSLLPAFIGLSGWIYAAGAFILGMVVLQASFSLNRSGRVQDARRLLRMSLLYLPLWMILIVTDLALR